MKVILEFNRPEDNEDIEIHMNAVKYYCALTDFSNYLRSKLKYAELSEEEAKILEEVRTKFFEIQNDNEINI